MLSESEIGKKRLEWSEMSPLEILQSYEIKDDRVKAGILYLGCKWGIEPDLVRHRVHVSESTLTEC